MKYLDTTLVAEALVGSRARQRSVRELLAGDDVMSSTYVREEFKNTFLKDAVAAHSLLVESEDIVEAHERIGETFGPREEYRQCRWIILAIEYARDQCKKGEIPYDPLEVAKELLAQKIESELMDAFEELTAGGLLDGTECKRAAEPPEFDPAIGTFTFKPHCNIANPRPCAISSFMETRRSELESLSTGPAELDGAKPDKRRDRRYTVRKSAKHALESPKAFRGDLCTKGLSDAIIAMECPDNAEVCTTDKHFGPLCNCLNKRLNLRRFPRKKAG